MNSEIITHFENGNTFINGQEYRTQNIPWNEHPAFKGVSLKHIITGEQTGNQISCHLVRILPGAKIGMHNHAGQIEIHEIISGEGNCMIGDCSVQYFPGEIALIPADIDHEVAAGENGLFLLAKFSPALV